MAPTYLSRKESDRTGHKKQNHSPKPPREEHDDEEEKKAAEEQASTNADEDDAEDDRKPAAVEVADSDEGNGNSEDGESCSDSEYEGSDDAENPEVATANTNTKNDPDSYVPDNVALGEPMLANPHNPPPDPDTDVVAKLAAAIRRAEEQLAARTPSPVIYQGAPVSLARSPTTLLPPTHPSYTGNITPSHTLYPYTNAFPPPECICHLFPPSTRPHIYSPTNSEDEEEESNAASRADPDAEGGSGSTHSALVQPNARKPRPHQFVNPRNLVPLPANVEEYLEDSDLDDPLLRQFHALTIDLPDRPWNGGPITRGFRDPSQPRPTQQERERRREERRRRYIENRKAQEERERLAEEEQRRREEEEGAENGDDNVSDGSSDEDGSSDGDGSEDSSGNNGSNVADLSEGISRLDLSSEHDNDDDEESGNSSQSSSRSSASSSVELGPELEALVAAHDPSGRMDQEIRTALANYIPSDEDEGPSSSNGEDASEEDDDSSIQPQPMNFGGMLGEPMTPPMGMGLRPGSFGQPVTPPLEGMPPPMGMMPPPPMGIMPPPPMMSDADMMFGLGDIMGGGFGIGLPTAAGGPRRRLSNSSTDSEDMYLNTTARNPPMERIRYRKRRMRSAGATKSVRTASGGSSDGYDSDDSNDSDGSENDHGKGSGGGDAGGHFPPIIPKNHKGKGKPTILGPDGELIPDYALPAEFHTKAVRRLLYVSNEIKIDWGNILHRIIKHPEEASEYTGHQAPTLLLCFERRAPLPVIEALVYNDKKMPYHQDGSGDTALHYFSGGYDIPIQPKKCRDHFPRYAKYICEKNPKLALLPNCAGVLPVHTCNDFECSSILIKAAPEGIMFRSIFDGWTALHSRCDYFINSNDDSILIHGGEDLFLNRDESPPIVRMLVEEGLNLTWDILSDARVHNSPAVRVPGYHRLALGGVMVNDKSNRSPFHRICRGINNKLTNDGRAKENYYDKVLHMLWAKLRTFAQASYVASVYETNRRKQMQQFVENGGTEEDARKLPHKRISLEDVGMGHDDPPYILLHELIRLRVPAKIVMQAMRFNDEEIKAVGRCGRKALHLAAEAGYNFDVLKVMIDIDPEVVDQPDPLTGLLPFMLASLSKTKFIETDEKNKENDRLTSVFQLLVGSPQSLLGQSDSKTSSEVN